ncbi:MAG: hypothetical protein J0I14_02640 [Propionibacteriaceae bacterium]|nr:hypothetical protein [Propionibacteriaceae bacterium]
MTTALVLLVIVPLAATVACVWLPLRAAQAATLASGLVSLGLVLTLLWAPGQSVEAGWLMVDPLSLVFLLAVGFLYPAVAAYSIGYLADEANAAAAAGPQAQADFERYARRFSLGLNAFAWAMLCAPAVNGLALLWVAIEVTTVISALLVAIDATDGATEAAWKYVLIASSGLGIGLLATVFMYYAGAQVLGQSYDLAFAPLLQHAAQLPATPVRLAFVLAVLGFGTKVGLFPVHTWLPDAHSEAPSPVSALLSGALLVVSFYAILRYLQVAQLTLGAQFPHDVLLIFGVASLALAALYLLDQRDLKRLLAYSSVEHMGILAIGVGFGAPMAAAGVLLHVLGHAAAKGNAFMGAGVLVRRFGTKDLHRLRGGLDALRWTGPLLLLAVLALSGMPPFALFRSEFQIVVGGFTTSAWAAAALVGLVVIAFAGLAGSITSVLFRPRVAADDQDEVAAMSRAGSGWMLAPVIAGVVVLIVLGVHPPAVLSDLLARGAAELTGGQ